MHGDLSYFSADNVFVKCGSLLLFFSVFQRILDGRGFYQDDG
jgi:hypothetical protein